MVPRTAGRTGWALAATFVLGSVAMGCASPGEAHRSPGPLSASTLHVLDGVILDGGFDAVLRGGPALGVREVGSVPAQAARARWGTAGEGGAVLLSRGDAPSEGATLREVLIHHASLLEALWHDDPVPGDVAISVYPDRRRFGAWARLVVLIDGEIQPLPTGFLEEARSQPGDLPREPPPDWPGSLGSESASSSTIRSNRGAEAARLYGTRAWFGVVEVRTGAPSEPHHPPAA